MQIAIITGASAGLGLQMLRYAPEVFPEIEQLWLVARRTDKLEEAARVVSVPCRLFSLDLTEDDNYAALEQALRDSGAQVRLLINNSGCGYLGNAGEGDVDRQIRMVDLNVKGLTAVTHMVLPYMREGGRILNVSSIASFCPNARMTVYSATKAYVTAFTFGISEELKSRGIKATVVCPGPMDTEFIYLGGIKGFSKTFDALPYCNPEKVAMGALKAAKKGRTVYTPRFFYKLYRLLAKLLPTKLVMKFSGT